MNRTKFGISKSFSLLWGEKRTLVMVGEISVVGLVLHLIWRKRESIFDFLLKSFRIIEDIFALLFIIVFAPIYGVVYLFFAIRKAIIERKRRDT